MDDNKNGRGTARSTSWATPSAYKKREPGQTAGRSSRHYEGHRPDALQGSWWGRKNTSNVPDCIRFATWNIGTMSDRSAEVVETLPFLSPNQQCQSTEGKKYQIPWTCLPQAHLGSSNFVFDH